MGDNGVKDSKNSYASELTEFAGSFAKGAVPRNASSAKTMQEANDAAEAENSLMDLFLADKTELNRITSRSTAMALIAAMRLFMDDEPFHDPVMDDSRNDEELFKSELGALSGFDGEVRQLAVHALFVQVPLEAPRRPAWAALDEDCRDMLNVYRLPTSLLKMIREVYLSACLSQALGSEVRPTQFAPGIAETLVRWTEGEQVFRFATHELEPIDLYRKRAKAFISDVQAALLGRILPASPRGPKRTQLGRNCDWLYRVRVKREDPENIAEEDGLEGERESVVRSGITDVLALFGDDSAAKRKVRPATVSNSKPNS